MPLNLSLADPVQMQGGRWVRNWMDVLLHRTPEGTRAFGALFSMDADFEFRLTPDEADVLAGKLTHLAEVIRGNVKLDETVVGSGW